MSTSHTRNKAREGGSCQHAQASVELLSYAAFFMLVFVAAVSVFFQIQGQEMARAESAYAQQVAYGFADNIRTAFVAGSGFEETISLPTNILGKPYTLSVTTYQTPTQKETGFVYVDWRGQSGMASYSAPTIAGRYTYVSDPDAVSYDASSSRIVINASKGFPIKINNTNGIIYIQKG